MKRKLNLKQLILSIVMVVYLLANFILRSMRNNFLDKHFPSGVLIIVIYILLMGLFADRKQ